MLRRPLAVVLLVVGLIVTAGAAAAVPVRATYGAQTSVDEPWYLLSALSLAVDGDLDIADELAGQQFRAFHEVDLNEQTRPLAGGRRLSPHEPGLPLLLAVPLRVGGWVGAKLALAATAGLLAAATLWVAVRRFEVPVPVAAPLVVLFGLSPPLGPYATQVYPEVPAALATVLAVGALARGMGGPPGPQQACRRAGHGTGFLGTRDLAVVAACVVALPWLAVKFVPVAATLAALALWRLLREGARGRAVALTAGLALSGLVFAVAHQAIYGGWTSYVAGDHFVGGEFTAVGAAPDYLGRSRRLLGLLIDRHFGLVPWQPAWVAVVPALAAAVVGRWPGRAALLLPAAAGWLTAAFVALTMHGWWWPGRQVVVVAPLGVLVLCRWAADRPGVRRPLLAVAALGLVGYGWFVVEALSGRLTWVVDFYRTTSPVVNALRPLLPDYLAPSTGTWVLHGLWLAGLAATAWITSSGGPRRLPGARGAWGARRAPSRRPARSGG